MFPKVAGPDAAVDLSVGAPDQLPFAVVQDLFQESVRDADRVIGILSGNGEVGFRIPVGVEFREFDFRVPLAGEMDHPLDEVFRDHRPAAFEDGLFQAQILVRVEPVLAVAFAACPYHRVQVLGGQLGPGHQGRDLLFFLNFPVDELLDIRMVDIDDNHLGGAAGCAAGLDGAGRAVADLEETHQAGRLAAAGKAFVFAPQGREIGAGAGPVLEQPGFANPKIHDAAFVDQVVGDALDEAGVRLWALVGGAGLDQATCPVIDVGMALGGAVDAIGPIEAGVEPLR